MVTQLSQHEDFESEETFFTVVGLLTQDKLSEIMVKLRHIEWPDVLPADEDYELVIYHYHSSKSPSEYVMSASTGAYLTLESSPKLRLDSRYDLKKLRIRTGDPTFRSKRTWITLSANIESMTETLELDMELTVKANYLKRVGIAALIAIGLTVGQAVPLVTRTDLGSGDKLALGLLVLLASIAVAVAVVWGIRRSI